MKEKENCRYLLFREKRNNIIIIINSNNNNNGEIAKRGV